MSPYEILQEALEALGAALVKTDHEWTSRERWLYERAHKTAERLVEQQDSAQALSGTMSE